jgi:periplasmic protein TonB
MTKQEERQKKTKAFLYTIGVNVLVFLILFFAAAWRTAGSGEGEYPGIEVNLGYDDYGSGNIQPKEPIGTEEAKDDQNAPAKEVNEPKQETPTPTTTEANADTKTVQSETITDPNSDVEIKTEKKETKSAEKPVEKKVETVEKPVEKKVETPKVDTKAVYQGKSKSNPTTSGEGEGKEGTTGSEGDDTGKTGDKGVEGGIEGAAIYKGTPGGGDGGSIVLNGWDWDKVEKPSVPQNETGKVVFEIVVDENGELIARRKISGTVSAAAEKACIEALEKITFTKKPGAKVPPETKGTITFIIRAE